MTAAANTANVITATATAAVHRVPLTRHPAMGVSSDILAEIHRDEVDIAVWQRVPDPALNDVVGRFIASQPFFQQAVHVTPGSAAASLEVLLRVKETDNNHLLRDDIAALVDRFCGLFGCYRAALRLSVLDYAMCPKFHVDHVPCRLVTTYLGVGTEWLPHAVVDRSKLGAGSGGKPDHQSGLYHSGSDIQRLQDGHVALLKGKAWAGNERAGLVHRSPTPDSGERRLLLTLDMIAN
ncbi:MAG: DUF1826 domain-containing protein [Pseudomonadota bacterium]